MSVIWQKVWFDLWNNKVRTILAVISIAVGVFAVGTIFGMNDQMLTSMDSSHKKDMAQHFTMNLTVAIDREIALALRKVPGVDDVEPYNDIGIRYRFPNDENWHQGVVMMRDDYRNQKYQLLQLKAGEWPKGGELGMEYMQADYYHLQLGDRVIVEIDKKERPMAITSKIRHPYTPPPAMGYDLAFFFTDAEGMERFGMPQGKFTSFMVRVTPYNLEHAKEVATEIKDRLGQQNIGVAYTEFQDPDKHWGRVFMDSFVLVLDVMAAVSLVLSTVLVLNTFMALITQQTNQIGMLKAVGGTSKTVIQIYLAGVLAYGLLALSALLLAVGAIYCGRKADWGTFGRQVSAIWARLGESQQVLITLVTASIVYASAWMTWGVDIAAAYRRAGDTSNLIATLAAATIFYISPWLVLTLISGLILLALIILRCLSSWVRYSQCPSAIPKSSVPRSFLAAWQF